MTETTRRYQVNDIDYSISDADAKEIIGAVLLPYEYRRMILQKYCETHGPAQVLDLFAQFMGLANSVVANNREVIEALLACDGDRHPNLPTISGALNGVSLASAVDQSKTCAGCAARLGTAANQSPATTCDLDYSSHPGEADFMCHLDLDENNEPHRKCIGFAQIRSKRKKTGTAK